MRVHCHFHNLTMDGDELRQHEIDHHSGANIAVSMVKDNEPFQSIIKICGNPVEHRPATKVTQKHHVIPISWGGGLGEVIPLCGSCHDTEHELLNHFVRANGRPAWEILRNYPRFLVELAQGAWDNCKQERRPYTTHRGELGA